ncbi:MAG: hypothetical protein AAB482_04090 [Patescibacteria group bacterium]
MYQRKRFPQWLKKTVGVVALGLVVGIISTYADWTAPTASFPTCPSANPACNTPVNIGTQVQTKTGNLTLSGGLNMASTMITGLLGPPVNGTDAANKAYVDAQVSQPQIKIVKASGANPLSISCPAGYVIFKCGASCVLSLANASSNAVCGYDGATDCSTANVSCGYSAFGNSSYTHALGQSLCAILIACVKQ